MSENIREYLTHRRRDENGDYIWPKSVIDGQYIMKYAIRHGGDVDQQMEWAREWVTHVCKNPDKDIPNHIILYSMGGVLSATCLLQAWQEWHEVSGNYSSGLSILHLNLRTDEWMEQRIFGQRRL